MKKVDYTLYFITNSDGYDEETFLNKIPAQNLFSLHIWQDLALLPHNNFHDREQIYLLTQALIFIPFPSRNSVMSSSTASSPSQ